MLNIKAQSGHWEMWPELIRTHRHRRIHIKKSSPLPPQLSVAAHWMMWSTQSAHTSFTQSSQSLPSHPEQNQNSKHQRGPAGPAPSASQERQESLTKEYLHFSPHFRHHCQAPAELMLQQEKVKEIIIMHQLAENRKKPRKAQYTCNH